MTVKIQISAGELSADKHGAALVKELLDLDSTAIFKGMGGAHLRAAGVETVTDSESLASLMGFTELIGSIRLIRQAFNEQRLLMRSWRPDLLIIIDYPDFNLRLAREAKKLGIKVVYYIPPKLWAWREKRIKKIKKYVDQVIALFPFEEEFYRTRGYKNIAYLGNPSVDEVLAHKFPNRANLLSELGLSPERPLVTLLPGSRSTEINRHLPLILAGYEELRSEHPELQACIVLPQGYNEALPALGTDVKTYRGPALDLFKLSEAAVLKSGTNNLEAAICGLPFVMLYTASKSSAFLVRKLVNIKQFSLVNILRPDTVMELLQEQVTPRSIATELGSLLYNRDRRSKVEQGLKQSVLTLMPAEANANRLGTVAGRAAKLIMETAAKPTVENRSFTRMFNYLSPYKLQFLIALLCMAIFGASDGIMPFLVKSILDGVFTNRDTTLLYMLPLVLIGFAALRAVTDFGQQFLMARIGHYVVRDIRNDLERKFLTFAPDFYIRNPSADLVARVTGDVVLLRTLLTDSVAAVVRDALRIVALVIAALYLDPALAAIALLVFPVGIYPVYRFGRKVRKLSRVGQEAIGKLSALLQGSMLGIRVVKIFGRESFESRRFQAENQNLTQTFVRSELARAISGPINEILAAVAISGVIIYGGYSVIGGLRTQGDFIAFLLSVFLLYDPFKKLSRVNSTVQQGLAGADRIFEILDQESPIKDPVQERSLPPSNEIRFNNVFFSYNGENAALENINLVVPEKGKIALVGFSGSGKSTLVDLIPRFIDTSAGEVLIGGVNVRDLKLLDLRSRIAMVSQHTFLFNDTIFNNIAYGNPEASAEDIYEAARIAYAYDFITALPHGFQTMVGESGFALSGGERQRIAIARAVLKNAPILILDEATASLDNRAEQEVQRAIEALEAGRTSIIIAHRLSTVRNADKIVVLKDGRIVEVGTDLELLRNSGEYAKLHALQFREPTEEVAIAN